MVVATKRYIPSAPRVCSCKRLAHNCVQEFKCLKAVSVDDVVSAAGSILKS